MANKHERPVKPHTIDKRSEKAAQQAAVSKPLKPQHLDRADRGINPGHKPGK